MFGYVKPYVPTLLVKEHEFYRAAYCGLCRSMRKHTGALSAISLRYDYLLLLLVRMLYLPDESFPVRKRRCPVHPLRSRPMLEDNEALQLVVDVSAVLGYYQLKDTQADSRGMKKATAYALQPIFARAKRKAKRKALEDIVAPKMQELSALENANCPSVDQVADVFGELLGQIFAFGLADADALVCHTFGKHIGRFIYIADAAEDYEKDVKENTYNPLKIAYAGETLTDQRKKMLHTALTIELAEAESAMHLFPAEDTSPLLHIIQNTVYEGLVRRIAFLEKEPAEERTSS